MQKNVSGEILHHFSQLKRAERLERAGALAVLVHPLPATSSTLFEQLLWRDYIENDYTNISIPFVAFPMAWTVEHLKSEMHISFWQDGLEDEAAHDDASPFRRVSLSPRSKKSKLRGRGRPKMTNEEFAARVQQNTNGIMKVSSPTHVHCSGCMEDKASGKGDMNYMAHFSKCPHAQRLLAETRPSHGKSLAYMAAAAAAASTKKRNPPASASTSASSSSSTSGARPEEVP